MALRKLENRAVEFRRALSMKMENGILVADGAMGTRLLSNGVRPGRCLDELNLSLPALVRDVHQEYLRAGAEIVSANTFGANRKRLKSFGFEDRVEAINRAGVRIAREAARDQAFVAGIVGPTGERMEPWGNLSEAEAREVFRQQVEALTGAGVDLLVFETFQDLAELRAAVVAARQLVGDALVLAGQVTVSAT